MDMFAPKSLQELDRNILSCKACSLGKPCIDTSNAGSVSRWRVIFVGEAPGANEVVTKTPFTGPAGKEFDSILLESGFLREEVYVSNVVRARPVEGKKNRAPKKGEIDACLPHISAEIDIVNPLVVVCMGATPLNALANQGRKDLLVTKERGSIKVLGGRRYLITHHPSFVLRSMRAGKPAVRGVVISDLRIAKEILEGDYFHIIKAGKAERLYSDPKFLGSCSRKHANNLIAAGYGEEKGSGGLLYKAVPVPGDHYTVLRKEGRFLVCIQDSYLSQRDLVKAQQDSSDGR